MAIETRGPLILSKLLKLTRLGGRSDSATTEANADSDRRDREADSVGGIEEIERRACRVPGAQSGESEADRGPIGACDRRAAGTRAGVAAGSLLLAHSVARGGAPAG